MKREPNKKGWGGLKRDTHKKKGGEGGEVSNKRKNCHRGAPLALQGKALIKAVFLSYLHGEELYHGGGGGGSLSVCYNSLYLSPTFPFMVRVG